jgi:hypothetical protein
LPEEAVEPFAEIEATARAMDAAFLSTRNPLDLPANTDHCSAYGGCPFQGNCNLSPFDRLPMPPRNSMGNSLLDRLNRAKEAAAPAASVYPVNPPEGVRPTEATSPATQGAAPTVTIPAPPPEPAAEPKRRGRPPGVKNKPAEATPPEAASPETQYVATFEPGAKKIGVLYVDCSPSTGALDAFVFILAAKTALAADGLADYRLAEFGHGPGKFALAVGAAVDAFPGDIHALRVDSRTPEGTVALTELMARAVVVVR